MAKYEQVKSLLQVLKVELIDHNLETLNVEENFTGETRHAKEAIC